MRNFVGETEKLLYTKCFCQRICTLHKSVGEIGPKIVLTQIDRNAHLKIFKSEKRGFVIALIFDLDPLDRVVLNHGVATHLCFAGFFWCVAK